MAEQPPEVGRLQHGPLIFVINAGAAAAHETRETIAHSVAQAGRQAEFVLVQHARELPDRAEQAAEQAQAQQGILVAVGGDGTLNAVASAALAADVPMGVLPMGTFNFFSRNLGLPDSLEEALAVLLTPGMRELQLGQLRSPLHADAQVFLVSASVGFYPRLIEDREHWKQRLGRYRGIALGAGLWTLLSGHRTLHLSLRLAHGGVQRIKTSTLLISDNALQLDRLGLSDAQTATQGLLTALLVRASSRWRLLGLALRGALGRLAEDDNLLRLSCEQLEVKVHHAPPGFQFKVAIDGEIVHHASPLHFELAQRKLKVLVPQSQDPVEVRQAPQ